MGAMLRLRVIFTLVFLVAGCNQGPKDQDIQYQFIIAGHTYGAHHGDNLGLYPKFLKKVKKHISSKVEALFLNGDFVRDRKNLENINKTFEDINGFSVPSYLVIGNHDLGEDIRDRVIKKHGKTYFSVDFGENRFVILNTMFERRGSIVGDQLVFLRSTLANRKHIKNIFILMHELIWTFGKSEYKKVIHNMGSYDHVFGNQSNFWSEVYPLVEEAEDINFYIIGGDVGGNPNVIPAFYHKRKKNITFLASGMGEVKDENFLKVSILKSGKVHFDLIPLNFFSGIKPLEHYQKYVVEKDE